MKVIHLLLTLATVVPNPRASGTIQETLMEPESKREKVPGNNPAYYTRENKADQLLEITEFIVSPSPPLKRNNTRVFFYLQGFIAEDYAGLENSTLTLRSKF
ncbi:hypothetical protein BCR34DRAFT_605164 [Clohesyomyces aquaticus]|uniref:Uncharacterized protein n=1 Tax=Clohesyomyces aquaticus TaxID=1231657 RepID=A0A1Y1Z152_9PLEO|nr:hypothetical protein BCR34DRAFT_605164 [Clohesyomyces aquaticus]